MKLKKAELKDFLDSKVKLYNNPKFIESDPIQIPHLFSKKEDIEIIGFLTATIAWGNRKSIITNANRMVDMLDHSPFEFVMQHQESDLEKLQSFVHRTFNGYDFIHGSITKLPKGIRPSPFLITPPNIACSFLFSFNYIKFFFYWPKKVLA